jgi:hypothetical protein
MLRLKVQNMRDSVPETFALKHNLPAAEELAMVFRRAVQDAESRAASHSASKEDSDSKVASVDRFLVIARIVAADRETVLEERDRLKAMISSMPASTLQEVSAGEALREAHNACRCGGRQLVLSQAEPPFQMECDGLHAALDAAVAAAVREERSRRGHVKQCRCHEQCLKITCNVHPYTDPRCEVKE